MSDKYENPLCKRYASAEMQHIFSDTSKFSTWRKLWVTLAESQMELGLDVNEEQIAEMNAHIYNIDYEVAARYEAETRHDVMAHILAYGDQCPKAKPIIHLGATSAYVGDNTDIILQKKALAHIKKLLINALNAMHGFSNAHKALPCLAYTHLQAAQPTTVGKRATLWIQDLLMDLEHLELALQNLKLLGCRGTTGTGASFLRLFDGDHEKVKALELKIADKMGFESENSVGAVFPVSGQTYSRKVDYFTLSVLSSIAQSAYKFSNDIRLLSHMKEIDEPFEDGQVGSSAMAYKRNPMKSERIASLARYVTVTALNPALTSSAQWLERTLDDSANRRISIPEAFLATDAILSLVINIFDGITVYPNVIKKRLDEELAFMATEDILMHCVKKGGDRQVLHEKIRKHSVAAGKKMKQEGSQNDLLDRILTDETFGLCETELQDVMSADKFTGMAEIQTEEFLSQVKKVIEANKALLGAKVEIKV